MRDALVKGLVQGLQWTQDSFLVRLRTTYNKLNEPTYEISKQHLLKSQEYLHRLIVLKVGFIFQIKSCFQSRRKRMLRQWLQASIRATRRAVAWNLKGISPPAEVLMFNFAKPEDLNHWEVYSDSKHGGLSSATLDLTRNHPSTAVVFSGCLSENVADGEPVPLKRSGFVGMRTMEDRCRLDLEPFQALLFRVKGDGRCYISTLRTESWVTGPTEGGFNTWQAFLFAPRDEWSTIEIPVSRYLPTWRGKILPVDHEMNLRSVTGLGLSTTVEGPEEANKGPGDFRLEIQWIKAIQTSI